MKRRRVRRAIVAVLLLLVVVYVARCMAIDTTVRSGVVIDKSHSDAMWVPLTHTVNEYTWVTMLYIPETWNITILGDDAWGEKRDVSISIGESHWRGIVLGQEFQR